MDGPTGCCYQRRGPDRRRHRRPPDTLALTRCAISPPLIFLRIPFTYVHAPALYNEPFIPLYKGGILSMQWHWRQCNSQLAPYTQQITRKKKVKIKNYKMTMIFFNRYAIYRIHQRCSFSLFLHFLIGNLQKKLVIRLDRILKANQCRKNWRKEMKQCLVDKWTWRTKF